MYYKLLKNKTILNKETKYYIIPSKEIPESIINSIDDLCWDSLDENLEYNPVIYLKPIKENKTKNKVYDIELNGETISLIL